MTKVAITWKCGHRIEVPRAEMPTAAICGECGERIVKNVTGAAPRFTGSCTGPLVVRGTP